MRAGDVRGDGQPQAHAGPGILIARGIEPDERAHRLLAPLERDARTVILDPYTQGVLA